MWCKRNPAHYRWDVAEDLPIACSLNGSDLAARLAGLAQFGAETLTARSSDRDGHRLRFRRGPAVEARLRSILAAEEECCPFLNLTLIEADDELELRISSSPDGYAVAAELAAAFG
jgi:hypothetical protein